MKGMIMRYFLGMLIAATLAFSPVAAQVVQDVPMTTTTIVQGGTFVSELIEWLKLAFGGAVAAALVALSLKVLNYMGVKTTDVMKGQLQAIIVNGINASAAKAEKQVGDLTAQGKFSIDVKNQVIADAMAYTQIHGGEIIKALGLDPKSGEAVSAINARIQSAITDPMTPTNPALKADDPKAPVVVVAAGAKA